ncbi:glycosyltransferase family 2 protein [Chryseobacterium sp. NFX27]|uniref:glycosyltransferase family 2 protein n=1 Tax=Chryseobacterium sp. NFX27 TaxID=2819618 RepID=UPI003CF6DC1C
MKLSVCYIVLNGERVIEKSISSVYEIADEIIVVDSFSTDKTEEICTGFPKVKFFRKKFHGFGCQKNYTLSEASGEWILFLDSDEVPDKRAVKAIKEILTSSSPAYNVYEIHFNNILLKTTIKYGGWGNVWRERFFRKGHGKYSDDLVHECFITQDKKGKLPGNIDHYTYKSIAHHIEKINTYTQLMAEKKVLNGKSVSLFKIIFSPFYDFMRTYFFKLGFLDGVAGFYISITGAFYTFLKYIKINEIHKFK